MTFCSDNVLRLLDHAAYAKDVLQRPHIYSLSGSTQPSAPDDLHVAFRCHFKVPEIVPANDEEEEKAVTAGGDAEESNSNAGVLIDADLSVFDPLLEKYVHMLIVDEETGEKTPVPLNRFQS